MSRTIIFLLGLIALALLTFLCIRKHTPEIQSDIQSRAVSVLSSEPTRWTKVAVDGRNVILTGVAPSEELREKAEEMAKSVQGVVSVDNQITVTQPELESVLEPESESQLTQEQVPEPEPEPVIQSPYENQFTKTKDGIVLSGWVPDEDQHQALLLLAKQKFGEDKVIDKLQVAAGAPDGWLQTAKAAITGLAYFKEGVANITDTKLDLSGEVLNEAAKVNVETELPTMLPENFKINFDLNVPQLAIEEIHPEPVAQDAGLSCAKAFEETLAGEKIHFATDSAGVRKREQSVLEKVVEFSNSCPNSIIEVSGYTDARGSEAYNKKLSQKRAEAVVQKLIKKGLRPGRVKAKGYGEANPLSENSSRQGQALNRRIEFKYINEGE